MQQNHGAIPRDFGQGSSWFRTWAPSLAPVTHADVKASPNIIIAHPFGEFYKTRLCPFARAYQVKDAMSGRPLPYNMHCGAYCYDLHEDEESGEEIISSANVLIDGQATGHWRLVNTSAVRGEFHPAFISIPWLRGDPKWTENDYRRHHFCLMQGLKHMNAARLDRFIPDLSGQVATIQPLLLAMCAYHAVELQSVFPILKSISAFLPIPWDLGALRTYSPNSLPSGDWKKRILRHVLIRLEEEDYFFSLRLHQAWKELKRAQPENKMEQEKCNAWAVTTLAQAAHHRVRSFQSRVECQLEMYKTYLVLRPHFLIHGLMVFSPFFP